MLVYFKGEFMNKFQLKSISKLLKKYQNKAYTISFTFTPSFFHCKKPLS